jgi:hypothetical protein
MITCRGAGQAAIESVTSIAGHRRRHKRRASDGRNPSPMSPLCLPITGYHAQKGAGGRGFDCVGVAVTVPLLAHRLDVGVLEGAHVAVHAQHKRHRVEAVRLKNTTQHCYHGKSSLR